MAPALSTFVDSISVSRCHGYQVDIGRLVSHVRDGLVGADHVRRITVQQLMQLMTATVVLVTDEAV